MRMKLLIEFLKVTHSCLITGRFCLVSMNRKGSPFTIMIKGAVA
ncbi:hypothetical protein SCAZ3_01820 [Streptococcus canis FSL Z3-227]|uniref:Uncharacterized protein n=1 Tax=Streptococcus canis FSL Z3-227 TaxID=482234 RepID=A0AAV3FPW5_STRCB|nr:hypothetical protein SCAZ3_01820 [Streptococcus canis FSL Z3-227]